MNKLNLFLIMSIGAVFATASIFGSTMTTAFAQGNDTGEVQVGPPLVFTAENATLAGNATNATTAAAGDSVVGQTPQVDATQNQATSDGETSDGETSDGETSDGETSDGETSDNGNDGSDNGNDGSDNGNDGSDNGNDGSDNEDESNN
ncbi:hypothetical protein NMY3_01672 [Candidatus Nitrosocosmicus oleophilus]|uniref:Uncharacterized protein n=1 Tax=Candidatus Nitrosocosmicus oleophilus TaxID=1353260 RepID=A0A654LXF4_9ARCH|nr:hypothetical protein [Candidatus Nitrosocosmicus oleophilus]ALI35875.1 hypothetical protein NMY3_01672 [Candidatus Nitrosocosmicus oleophilus]